MRQASTRQKSNIGLSFLLLCFATGCNAQQTINLGSQVKGTLAPTNGGTGGTIGAVQPMAAALYSATTTYSLGQVVKDASGYRFVSLSNANTGNAPSEAGDTAYWAVLTVPGPTGPTGPTGPAGTASSAGTQYAMQYSGGAGNSTLADNNVTVDPTLHAFHALGPRIDVQDLLFALGWSKTAGGTTYSYQSCAGVDGNTVGTADPTGVYNSECALRSAVQYGYWYHAQYGQWPTLYFGGGGSYIVNVTGTAPVLFFPSGSISLSGDGSRTSTIINTSAHAATAEWENAQATVHDLAFLGSGNGSGNATQDCLALYNAQDSEFVNVQFSRCIHGLIEQGSTERTWVVNFQGWYDQQAILNEGNANEDYFAHFSILNNAAPWAGPNANPHMNVFLDSDNVHIQDGSVKATDAGGIRLGLTTASVHHVYTEAGDQGNVTQESADYYVGGKVELSHSTAAITASALTMPVDTATYQPCYWPDPTDTIASCAGGVSQSYNIYPLDYLYGSTAASVAAPGALRGQYEPVTMQYFSGDGAAHFAKRSTSTNPAGSSGTAGAIAAFAWPANSVIGQTFNAGYGETIIAQNHIDMIHPGAGSFLCSDTALLPPITFTINNGGSGWVTGNTFSVSEGGTVVATGTVTATSGVVTAITLTTNTAALLGTALAATATSGSGTGLTLNAVNGWASSPSELCASVIAGWAIDGYGVQGPNSGATQAATYVWYGQNSTGFGSATVNGMSPQTLGEGVIAVVNATVTLAGEDGPLSTSPVNMLPTSTAAAFAAYDHPPYWLKFVSGIGEMFDPGQAYIYNGSTNTLFDSAAFNYLDQGGGTAVSTFRVSPKAACSTSGFASDGHPAWGLCYGNNGIFAEKWTPASGSTAGYWTATAIIGGTS